MSVDGLDNVLTKVAETLFTAYWAKYPCLGTDPPWIQELNEDVTVIYQSVKGNRPQGFPVTEGDIVLIFECAHKRAQEILHGSSNSN
jgi:hypothetical protein